MQFAAYARDVLQEPEHHVMPWLRLGLRALV
jgi:hypothetical protein